MQTLTAIVQIALLALALATGCSLAKCGVITASASVRAGVFQARILGRFVAVDLVHVYNQKYFYRVCIATGA